MQSVYCKKKKKKESLAVSLAPCLPRGGRSARGCASGHRGTAAADAAALPAPRCLRCQRACRRGRTNAERLWRRELGAGHRATGCDTQGCHSGDTPTSRPLVLAQRKKPLGCKRPSAFLWVMGRGRILLRPQPASSPPPSPKCSMATCALWFIHPKLCPLSLQIHLLLSPVPQGSGQRPLAGGGALLAGEGTGAGRAGTGRDKAGQVEVGTARAGAGRAGTGRTRTGTNGQDRDRQSKDRAGTRRTGQGKSRQRKGKEGQAGQGQAGQQQAGTGRAGTGRIETGRGGSRGAGAEGGVSIPLFWETSRVPGRRRSTFTPEAAAGGGEGCRGRGGSPGGGSPSVPPPSPQRCCSPATKGGERAFPRHSPGYWARPRGRSVASRAPGPAGRRRGLSGDEGGGSAGGSPPEGPPPAPGVLRPPAPHLGAGPGLRQEAQKSNFTIAYEN